MDSMDMDTKKSPNDDSMEIDHKAQSISNASKSADRTEDIPNEEAMQQMVAPTEKIEETMPEIPKTDSTSEQKSVEDPIKMEVDEQVKTESKAKLEPESNESKTMETKIDQNEEPIGETSKNEEEHDEDEEEPEPVVEYLDSAPLYRDPTFAEICSFFNTFSHLLGLKQMPYSKLEKLFCRLIDGDVDRELIDLHITLMRKIYLKSARADKWEKALQKFCSIAPGLESEFRQLQRHSYVDLPVATKLTILKALCDSQFDWNLKFKENIANTFRHNDFRIAPIGSDKTGQLYYVQIDCDLAYRVYAEEPEDMAGTSWTLKASNEAELVELIETLKSPEFGKKTKEQEEEEQADAEIDEEQLLIQPSEEEKKKLERRPSSVASAASKSGTSAAAAATNLQLSEEERAKVQMEGRMQVFWDRYKKQEILNKRKLERDTRKKERQTGATTIKPIPEEEEQPKEVEDEPNNEKEGKEEEDDVKNGEKEDEQKEEEKEDHVEKQDEQSQQDKKSEDKSEHDKPNTSELDEALLAELEAEDRRRVLPRRSARSTAILNLQVLKPSPRKRNDSAEVQSLAAPAQLKKLGFVATAGSGSEDESDEEESDEEEEEEGADSSDAEFLLDDDDRPKIRKIGRPPTKRMKAKSGKGGKGGAKGKGKKKNQRGRKFARPSASSLITASKARKHQSVAFVEEETSEEEGVEDEANHEEKERKKATELTLCQRCKASSRPDLLLLCDSCDDAWHTFCLHPQLWFVPDGDWFCPRCEHASLIRRLTYVLITVREERKQREQDEKKAAAADRLKREMDFIGISLNNIIPLAIKNEAGNMEDASSSDEEDMEDELPRKSKKRAMKIVTSRTRQQRKAERIYAAAPVMTIAEGRSRRALNKVDYNFRSYDEQLQEAMTSIDPDAKLKDEEEEEEAANGAGRGKDMQNIMDAERKREGEDEQEVERVAERKENAPARPPKAREQSKKGRKNKRLTDLDLDNATESDTDEWQAGSADEVEEDPEPSEDEYLPSERRNSTRGKWARHHSDDEFINDDSDPDYVTNKRAAKKKGKRGGAIAAWFGRGGRSKNRAKRRGRHESSTEEEEENDFQPSGSDSDEAGPSKKKRKVANSGGRKWAPKGSSSDEDDKKDQQSDEEEEESEEEITETGRPLRRAAAKGAVKVKRKLKELEEVEDEEEEEEGEEEPGDEKMEQETEEASGGPPVERLADRAVSALAKPIHRKMGKQNEEADEFQPDEEEEAIADEEEEEAEEELAEEPVDDEEDENEDKEESSSDSTEDSGDEKKEEEKPIVQKGGKRKASPVKAAPPAKKKAPARKKKPVGRKGPAKKATKKVKKDETESDDEEERMEEDKPFKAPPRKAPTPAKRQKSTEEQKPSTSAAALPEARQTRQQIRRQNSTQQDPQISNNSQAHTAEPSTSAASANGNQKQKANTQKEEALPITTTAKAAQTRKSPVKVKASANARSFDADKSPPPMAQVEVQGAKKTSLQNVQLQQPTKPIPAPAVQSPKEMQAKQPMSVNVVAASNSQQPSSSSQSSSPTVKTIFQAVHPQQLSQYFLRPSNTPPPPAPQQPSGAQRVTGASTTMPMQPTVMHAPPQARFVLQQPPTTNFAYAVPPTASAAISNGGPTYVTVAPPPLTAPAAALIHPQQLPPGAIPQFSAHSQPTAYFVQQGPAGAPPQIIYQTLQPYTTVMHPSSSQTQQIHQQQLQFQQAGMADPESLSHALAGAMNPEDL